MRAELLRERINIQVATRSKGAAGGRKTEWAAGVSVWARVHHVGAGDREDQGKERESRSYKVTIRYRQGISATENRLMWKGQLLDIVSVVADEKRTQVVMECVQGRGGSGPA
jgi:SPP1 family predicted phage head-tail adaptor